MNRQKEIEREWRRLARKEAWESWGSTLLFAIVVMAILIIGRMEYPAVFGPIMAFVAAIGMPLMMWLNRRDKK